MKTNRIKKSHTNTNLLGDEGEVNAETFPFASCKITIQYNNKT
jgi:hypothetical protein